MEAEGHPSTNKKPAPGKTSGGLIEVKIARSYRTALES
jgi:hypothetical protein